MATVIDNPPTAPSDTATQRRRRRESIEIIDVDLLDDGDITALQRPLQRRRPNPLPLNSLDTIVLVDSDDDDEPQIISPTSRISIGASRQRLRSLPPPPQNLDVPPVPPIPRRLAGFSGMPPMRRRPPSFPEAARHVVRPNAQPFAFEDRMDAGPSVRRGGSNAPPGPPPAVPLPAAPPSHHMPTMGFGGAILQMNDEAVSQDRRRRGPRPVPRHRQVRHVYMPFGIDEDINGDLLFEPHLFPEMDVIMRVLGNYGRNPPVRNKEPEYLPTYTHPAKPEPGFLSDFAPDNAVSDKPSTSFPVTSSENPIVITDDHAGASSSTPDQASSSSMQTLLVCACCSKPLLLNSQTSSKGPEEERKRRIWALRCGHLIDGECLDNISTPVVLTPQVASTSNGKGKAKVIKLDDETSVSHVSDSDWDADDLLPPSRYSRLHRDAPSSGHFDTFVASSGYPLRNRPLATPLTPPLASRGRRSHQPAKGGRKKREHFEWPCPVSGCERMHVSVRVGGGKWEMEKDSAGARGGKLTKPGRGAIAVFV